MDQSDMFVRYPVPLVARDLQFWAMEVHFVAYFGTKHYARLSQSERN